MQASATRKLAAGFLLAGGLVLQTQAAPLRAYGADPAQTSVSGLSSGGFMAVQLQVAYSSSIIGTGAIAAGPYYCAANNVAFVNICMGQLSATPPNPVLMAAAAKRFAGADLIDPLDNLRNRRIYAFSGTEDSIVRQSAVDATVAFFSQLGVKSTNIKYVNDVPAGHAFITPDKANECSQNDPPFINHCELKGQTYDHAGAILQHIYGTLNPRVGRPTGQVVSFDQRTYAPDTAGLADTGYLYVPPSCAAAGSRCKVHVALHGCAQSAEVAGDKFYSGAGYNQWADKNKLLILFPQVRKSERSPRNPPGCWDWWGYSGKDYALKSGPQMKAIHDMVNRLTQRP